MRKTLCLILTIIIISGAGIEAQQQSTSINHKPARFYFGYKAGMSISSFKGENTSGLDSRTGFIIGVFAKYTLTSALSIQPGFHYIMKGATEKGIYRSSPYKITYKLDYLEIPILLKLSMPSHSKSRPFFEGGVATGVKILSKIDMETDGSTDDAAWRRIENVDFGSVIGLGVDITFPNGLLGFEGQYIYGFILINKAGNAAEVRNSCFALSVSYGF